MKKALVVLISGMFLCALSGGVAFAQLAGKAIVEKACSKCHGLKKVTSANKNAAQWEATLDKMIKKGAQVTPGERDAVLKYLNTLNK
jgi:hypothetical protein